MAKEIGRLHSFGIGMEATPGTADTIDAWIPLESGNLTPKVEVVKDDSGLGNIAAPGDAHLTKTWNEFTAKGTVRPTSIGWLLLLAFGTASAATLQETGVYKHSFTVKNDNAHPSATIIHDNQTQEESATYNMIDSLGFDFKVGQIAKFDVKMKGQLPTNTSGNTPAFTSETPFVVSKISVKIAADVAGLAGASKFGISSLKFSIDKNLEQIFETRTGSVTDATNCTSQVNKNLAVKGDFEMIYNADTYKTLALAATKQAIEITLEGRTLIGATKYDTLTFQFASVVLEDWDRSDDLDGIVTQSFGFTSMYKLAETKMLTADLTNTKATQYA